MPPPKFNVDILKKYFNPWGRVGNVNIYTRLSRKEILSALSQKDANTFSVIAANSLKRKVYKEQIRSGLLSGKNYHIVFPHHGRLRRKTGHPSSEAYSDHTKLKKLPANVNVQDIFDSYNTQTRIVRPTLESLQNERGKKIRTQRTRKQAAKQAALSRVYTDADESGQTYWRQHKKTKTGGFNPPTLRRIDQLSSRELGELREYARKGMNDLDYLAGVYKLDVKDLKDIAGSLGFGSVSGAVASPSPRRREFQLSMMGGRGKKAKYSMDKPDYVEEYLSQLPPIERFRATGGKVKRLGTVKAKGVSESTMHVRGDKSSRMKRKKESIEETETGKAILARAYGSINKEDTDVEKKIREWVDEYFKDKGK